MRNLLGWAIPLLIATAAHAAQPIRANVDEARLMASNSERNAGQWLAPAR